MLYRPERPMWDSAIVTEGDEYHLFFMYGDGSGYGHAVSADLSTWTPRPDFDLRGEPGAWNEAGSRGAPALVKHEGRYSLLSGAFASDSGEFVWGLFTSDDLVEWEPHPANPVLRAPESFGQRDSPNRDWGMFNSWRDPFIVTGEDGQYHAYLCSRSGAWGEDRTGAVIAHASSADLITWEHHAPLLETDRVKYTEVPGLFELDGRHYAYFLDHGWGGLRIHTPTRDDSAGTYYLMADAPEGPYAWPDDPLLIGSGHDRISAWAARTFDYDGGILLYHHTVASPSAFGSFKRVRSRPDGTLYLEYFPGIRSLEVGDELRGTAEWQRRDDDVGVWTPSATGVSVRSRVVGSSSVLARDRSDLHLECTSRPGTAARAGVVLRSAVVAGERECRTGVAVTLDVELQQARIELLEHLPSEGWGLSALEVMFGGQPRDLDTVRLPLERDRSYALRCLARAEFFDVYLDDVWLFSRAIAAAPESGDVELMVERGEAAFTDLRLARLAPLGYSIPPASSQTP